MLLMSSHAHEGITMKKRYSDEQIISILLEAEAGLPGVSTPFSPQLSIHGVRSMAA